MRRGPFLSTVTLVSGMGQAFLIVLRPSTRALPRRESRAQTGHERDGAREVLLRRPRVDGAEPEGRLLAQAGRGNHRVAVLPQPLDDPQVDGVELLSAEAGRDEAEGDDRQ